MAKRDGLLAAQGGFPGMPSEVTTQAEVLNVSTICRLSIESETLALYVLVPSNFVDETISQNPEASQIL